ncbi:MAG TPA: hypothetical protein VMZ90_13895 [Vicinamibacterales bacterium]|nr:hypothetical protein [Vicinamibacterales bacterium]
MHPSHELVSALEEVRERRSGALFAELAKLGVVAKPGATEALALVSGAINYFVIVAVPSAFLAVPTCPPSEAGTRLRTPEGDAPQHRLVLD